MDWDADDTFADVLASALDELPGAKELETQVKGIGAVEALVDQKKY